MRFLDLVRLINRNYRGWRTNRKLVVFQSDDWGSIRMPSKQIIEGLKQFDVDVEECHYMRFDTIASKTDLMLLFEILEKHKDRNGNHPVITGNILTRNPNFEEIKKSNYTAYHSTLISDNSENNVRVMNSLKYWREGIRKGVFFPQLHGREHLNIERWLEALRNSNPLVTYAFKNNFWGINYKKSNYLNASLQAAFDFDESDDKQQHLKILNECFKDFRDLFGFESESFIAPNYVWYSEIEEYLKRNNIKFLQSGRVQALPMGNGVYKYLKHYTGEKNNSDQIYMVRNVHFEPSENFEHDWVDSAMNEIRIAFLMNKPAIINTHRLNYIGGIEEHNRTRSLKCLDDLLARITHAWPEVEFLNTVQLGKMIETSLLSKYRKN